MLIHPGGNSWGSGSRESLGNPDFIVSHDVVVVAINYRLHALGEKSYKSNKVCVRFSIQLSIK